MSGDDQGVDKLLATMARLRDPEAGCSWDVAQTFATIAPYTIEEAYEVADACERNDVPALKDELGDLLLQVVFLARIAQEAGAFAFADVVEGLTEKLIRRHPHVFAGEVGEVGDHARWDTVKAAERARAGQSGALDGVARALPALMRADKLQRRAARVGFDWPDASGARAKIEEELREVETAATPEAMAEEIGDLIFSIVNFARHKGVDSEIALRFANDKFCRRFASMELRAGPAFPDLSDAEKDALWHRAKQEETESD